MHREGILRKDKNLTRDRGRRAYSTIYHQNRLRAGKGLKTMVMSSFVRNNYIRHCCGFQTYQSLCGDKGKGQE